MPVSHVCLVVSHLPTSCSFFLTALSPLGYRYIGQQDCQIGFGIVEADFFICQASPGNQPGAAHIAFSAPSRNAVDDFFVAALKAGGLNSREPAILDQQTGYYSATVLDLDQNAIEVVHRDEEMAINDRPSSVISGRHEGSQVLEWQKDVARSIVSDRPASIRTALQPIINHITNPTMVVSHESERRSSGDSNSKALIGTLLGAAAGAAIAYVMTKGEAEGSPPQVSHLNRAIAIYRTLEAPPPPSPPSVSPRSYHAPTVVSRAPSALSPRPYHSSSPRAIEAPRPSPSRHTTLIDTFIPPTEIPRHILPESIPLPRSTASYMPSHTSKAPSHASTAKTITQADITRSKSLVVPLDRRNTEPSGPSIHGSQVSTPSRSKLTPSKAPSLLRSVTASEAIVSARSSHSHPRPSSSHSRPSSSRRSSHHSHHSHRDRSRSRESKREKESSRLDELVMPDDSISRVGGADGDGGERRRRRRKSRSVSEAPREKEGRVEREVRSVVTRVLGR